jgi:hypothetical protein
MRHQNGLQALLLEFQSLAPQILPLLVIPIFTIVALRIARSPMLGALFNWSSSRDSATSHESQDRKKLKKKTIRTRAEQLALLNRDAHAGTSHGVYLSMTIWKPDPVQPNSRERGSRSRRWILFWIGQHVWNILFHELRCAGASRINNPSMLIDPTSRL